VGTCGSRQPGNDLSIIKQAAKQIKIIISITLFDFNQISLLMYVKSFDKSQKVNAGPLYGLRFPALCLGMRLFALKKPFAKSQDKL
jgi:hypothetical protein